MSRTEVRFCLCLNVGQDELHGKNRRVHNHCVKGWRCTSCLTISGSPTALVGKGVKK